jgi:hypothetical protein
MLWRFGVLCGEINFRKSEEYPLENVTLYTLVDVYLRFRRLHCSNFQVLWKFKQQAPSKSQVEVAITLWTNIPQISRPERRTLLSSSSKCRTAARLYRHRFLPHVFSLDRRGHLQSERRESLKSHVCLRWDPNNHTKVTPVGIWSTLFWNATEWEIYRRTWH